MEDGNNASFSEAYDSTLAESAVNEEFNEQGNVEGEQEPFDSTSFLFGSKEEKPVVDPQDPEGKRFSYWQSEATKTKNELLKLQEQLQQVNPYIPLVRYIQEKPEILEAVEKSLSNPQGNVPTPPTPQVATLERPTPPQKPATFNALDAYNDPESESWKFREAKESYTEQLAEYMAKKEDERENAFKQQQMEQQMFEQRNQQLNQVANILKAQHAYNDNDITDFIKEFSDPKSLSLENLIELHKLKRGKVSTNGKAQEILQRQGKIAPTPAGVGGGVTMVQNQETDPNKLFSSMLKGKF